MIILDRALERRERDGNPVRVAMVGAGYMGRGIAFQMVTAARACVWWPSRIARRPKPRVRIARQV